MKLRYILIFLICSNTYATNLTFERTRSVYKIEYDPKTFKIKVLSKKNPTKECDKRVQEPSTKVFINNQLKQWDKKVVVTFTCM